MGIINKQKYFYYLAFMLIASTFLPLVFNNLPPFIRSHHLWTIIWSFSLLIFFPKILLNKLLLYVLLYGVLLFVASKTIWLDMDDWNFLMLSSEFYQIAIGISVITYFQQSSDYYSLAKITRWAIIFFFITAIMTLISALIDPMYARNLGGVSGITDENQKDLILSFKHFGGGTYSTAAAFMCIFPILIYYYKNIVISIISKKQIIIFAIILFFGLLGMQIFANIIIALIFSIIALMGMKKMKQSVFVIGLFIFVMTIIPKESYINGLRNIGNLFDNDSELNYKFNDFATYIEVGSISEDVTTGAGGRAIRYPILMETYMKSPILGCFYNDKEGNGYSPEGGHLYWMNKLTITGFVGLVVFILIFILNARINLRHFNYSYKLYYLLATLSILSYGFMKAISGRETWYAYFILIPGLYYLPLLKKSNK